MLKNDFITEVLRANLQFPKDCFWSGRRVPEKPFWPKHLPRKAAFPWFDWRIFAACGLANQKETWKSPLNLLRICRLYLFLSMKLIKQLAGGAAHPETAAPVNGFSGAC